MDILLRCAAAALTAAVMGLLIKQKNPELAMLLSIVTVAMILLAAFSLFAGIWELRDTVNAIIGRHEELTAPLFKCFAVGLLTKISGELCTEASNRAAGTAVELAGTLCALSLMMPLLLGVLKMIGGML